MPTCLIVTSEQLTQREYSAIVRALKFEAVCASSIQEARRRLAEKPLAVLVIDEWWSNGEDPMSFVCQLPLRNRPPIIVIQKVRLALSKSADYAVHRDDPAGLNEALAAIELKAHEQALELAEPQLQEAAE